MIHSRLAIQGIAHTCAPHQVGLLSTSQQPRGVSHISCKTIHQEPGESHVAPRPTSRASSAEELTAAELCYTPLIFSAVHSPYCSQREERVPEYRQAAAVETQPAALAGCAITG